MATNSTGQVCMVLSPSNSGQYQLATRVDAETTTFQTIASGIQNALLANAQSDTILRIGGELAFDGDGNAHTIQYYEIGGNGFLLYAKGQPGGSFVVQDNFDPGWWAKTGRPSLAVDAAGKAHIAYTSLWPYYQLNYLSETDSGWDRRTIDLPGTAAGYVGTYPDVLIDPNGTVHVVYADGLNGLLKHALLTDDQWQIEVIDTIGTQANYGPQVGALSAELDRLGNIGVAYWSGAEGTLKYAYLVPEPATMLLLAIGAAGLWRRRRV